MLADEKLDNCILGSIISNTKVNQQNYENLQFNFPKNNLIESVSQNGEVVKYSAYFRLKRSGLHKISVHLKQQYNVKSDWLHYAVFSYPAHTIVNGVRATQGMISGNSCHPLQLLINVTDRSTIYYVGIISTSSPNIFIDSSSTHLIIENFENEVKINPNNIISAQVTAIDAIKAQQATAKNELETSVKKLSDDLVAENNKIIAIRSEINRLTNSAIAEITKTGSEQTAYKMHPNPEWLIDYLSATKGAVTPSGVYGAIISTSAEPIVLEENLENISYPESINFLINIKKSSHDLLKIEISDRKLYLDLAYANVLNFDDKLFIDDITHQDNNWLEINGRYTLKSSDNISKNYQLRLQFVSDEKDTPATVSHEIQDLKVQRVIKPTQAGVEINKFKPNGGFYVYKNEQQFKIDIDFTKCDYFAITMLEVNTSNSTTILHKYDPNPSTVYRLWFHGSWHCNLSIIYAKTGILKIKNIDNDFRIKEISLWAVSQDNLLEFVNSFFNNHTRELQRTITEAKERVLDELRNEKNKYIKELNSIKSEIIAEITENKKQHIKEIYDRSYLGIEDLLNAKNKAESDIHINNERSIQALYENRDKAFSDIEKFVEVSLGDYIKAVNNVTETNNQIQNSINKINNNWFRYSNQDPDVNDKDYKIWVKQTDNDIEVFLKINDNAFISLRELSRIINI